MYVNKDDNVHNKQKKRRQRSGREEKYRYQKITKSLHIDKDQQADLRTK